MAYNAPYVVRPAGPGLLVRAVWFVFIGWWLGLIVLWVAWLLNVTIVGLPLGLWLINRLPTVITLRPQEQTWRVVGNAWRRGQEQAPFLLRAIYFVLIGWWLSLLWTHLAYVVLVTIIGLPIAFWMFDRVGAVTTLYRS